MIDHEKLLERYYDTMLRYMRYRYHGYSLYLLELGRLLELNDLLNGKVGIKPADILERIDDITTEIQNFKDHMVEEICD